MKCTAMFDNLRSGDFVQRSTCLEEFVLADQLAGYQSGNRLGHSRYNDCAETSMCFYKGMI